jgi:hypothetical protein
VPVSRGVRDPSTRREAEAAPRKLRPALGGEEPDPCRRPRQGQVQGTRPAPRAACASPSRSTRSKVRQQMLGNTLVTSRPARRQAGQPPLHRGRLRHRQGILSLDAGRPRNVGGSPSSSRPKAAWTSRRSRMTRPRRSSPSRSIRRPASCRTTAAPSRKALKLDRRPRQAGEKLFPQLYKAFVAKDMACWRSIR